MKRRVKLFEMLGVLFLQIKFGKLYGFGERFLLLRRHFFRRHCGGESLEPHTDAVNVDEVLFCHADDHGAAVRCNFNEPFFREAVKRAAYRRPADAELFRDAELGQRFALFEFIREDCLFQFRIDLRLKRGGISIDDHFMCPR